MKIAAPHPDEQKRLESLEALDILDTLPERDFDEIVALASHIADMPIALISLVAQDRQWFKAKVGISESETHRDLAFCAHAILQNEVFIVDDPQNDERFKNNPFVTDGLKVQFYAGAPLLSPDGYPIGTVCVIDSKKRTLGPEQISALQALSNQVTRLLELKKQIAKLKEAEAHLLFKKTATDSITEGLLLQEAEGRIVDFNPAALEVLGLSASELTGKTSMDPHWQCVHEDGSDFPGPERPAMICLKTGQKQMDVVMGVRRSPNQLRWLTVNSVPIFFDSQKLPSHVVTSFVDITESRAVQRKIQENQRELRFVLDSVPYMIGHWSAELMNLEANVAYQKYIGKSPAQMKGLHYKEVFGEELYAKNKFEIQSVLSGEVTPFERTNTTPEGQTIYSSVLFIPNIQNGKVVSFLSVVIDITNLRNLEVSRRNLEMQLIESARLSALGEMAGGVAHEINNPLAIILGHASLLKKKFETNDLDPQSDLRGFQIIENTVARIAKIIKGLRTYSRNADRDPFDSLSVSSIIDDTLELCRERFRHNQVILKVTCDPVHKIQCRSAQISQVLMNLLINAHDAVAQLKEKWIEVDVTAEGEMIKLSIRDSGQKINPDVAKKMMQPFFTTKEVGKGTGLGLSISLGIVQAHGGQLTYDSNSPTTCFILILPKVQSSASVKTA